MPAADNDQIRGFLDGSAPNTIRHILVEKTRDAGGSAYFC